MAEKLNRNWILIELNKDYCKIAQQRIFNYRKTQQNLFNLTAVVPPPIIEI
jgi:DNA modification methylase